MFKFINVFCKQWIDNTINVGTVLHISGYMYIMHDMGLTGQKNKLLENV